MSKSRAAPQAAKPRLPAFPSSGAVLGTYSLAHENFAQGSQGKLTTATALSLTFSKWLQGQMNRSRERITTREPLKFLLREFQLFLSDISHPGNMTLQRTLTEAWEQMSARAAPAPAEIQNSQGLQPRFDQKALMALKRQLQRWSEVQGENILKLLLSAEDRAKGAAAEVFAALALCPNRTFAYGLLFAGGTGWPLNMQSFRQMIWVTRYEFIHDTIHDLGRPLPLMEIADIIHGQDLEAAEQTIHYLLTPAELAYALAFGAFQLDFNPDNKPDAQVIETPRPRPRLRINPLFVEQRQ